MINNYQSAVKYDPKFVNENQYNEWMCINFPLKLQDPSINIANNINWVPVIYCLDLQPKENSEYFKNF